MLNWQFFAPRNLLIIGIVALLALMIFNTVSRRIAGAPAEAQS